MPRPTLKPRAASAVDYLLEATRSEPGEVVLIALGPFTNVAKALLEEPRLKEWLREIVVMGSTVGVPGNVTPHAEFNIYNDPRAANIVLSSGVPTTLVGLDACDQVFLEADDVGRFGDSRAERLAARMLKNWFRAQPDGSRYSLCDPLAILAAVQPDLLTYKAAEVSAEESDSEFLGKTEASFGDGPVRVTVTVDAADAMAEFRSMLASGVESSAFR